MTDIRTLHKEGFFPGLTESKEDFLERVAKVKSYAANPTTFIKKAPLPISDLTPLLPSFFQIKTKKRLPLWYGALTYIVEESPKVKIPLLQLGGKQNHFLKKEEIIAHEKVHALRVMYDEPRFEEILAYRTARSLWRQYISPLFASTNESSLFLFLLLFLFPVFELPLWLRCLPLLSLSIFFCARLFRRMRVLSKAQRALKKHTNHIEPLTLLLTDNEIASLAKGKDPFQEETYRIQCLKELFIDM